MPQINEPMDVPELNLQPPITGKMKLSEDMQQTLALICAYVNNKRVTLRASEFGVLNTVCCQIKDIVVFKATAGTKQFCGDNIPCTEIAAIAGLSNGDRAWVRPYKVADATNAWPLDKGEAFGFAISNLNQLHVTIQTADDIVVVAYTR